MRIDLGYDGSRFHGWAAQPGLRTVEGELTAALELVLRHPVRLTVAGRTDAGVHATAQVVHLDVEEESWRRLPGRSDRSPQDALRVRLGKLLARASGEEGPGDVIIAAVGEVPGDFDARFSALRRAYSYRLDDGEVPGLWNRRRAWRTEPVREADMEEAGALLLGEHDFLSYCKPREGATTIRTLEQLTCHRPDSGEDAGLVRIDLVADAFCHSMVRSIVGALVEVGRGRQPIDWPARRLAEARRDRGVILAPPHGLTLERVDYPETGYGLQARAARRMRQHSQGARVALTPDGSRQ
ncbi:MAG: tRNA pseudouridine(38-40) synthase TruA [Flaviflexus sp.]|nr:tRNA pseudouridine(38-40) synthase TruA [Flaviflexus sp.]